MSDEKSKLYYTLTGMDPTIRYAALSRVADPQQFILYRQWGAGRLGCLFVVMAAAVLRRPLTDSERSEEFIAQVLRMSPEEVMKSWRQWDNKSNASREKLRREIREYLATTYPVVENFHKSKSASRTLVSERPRNSFRSHTLVFELVGA